MSVVWQTEDGEKTVARRADPTTRGLRRLFMAQMKRSGCSIAEIARHYRYTPRHVKRELAEFRRQREQDDEDRRVG